MGRREKNERGKYWGSNVWKSLGEERVLRRKEWLLLNRVNIKNDEN